MNIGAAVVSRAQPDGYTLFVAPPAPLALAHLLTKNLNYSPLDWVPITLLAKIANVLSVRNSLPANTLQELIAYGKAIRQAYVRDAGPQSTAHLSATLLETLAGIKMLAVPYRGAQQALTDVVAGNVDMFFDTLATSVPLHHAGKLKILAVADLQRAKAAPELPTFSEAGVPAPLDHLVRPRRAARNAGRAGAADQPRCGRHAAQPRGHRAAAEPVARGRRDDPADTAKFFADETALWAR